MLRCKVLFFIFLFLRIPNILTCTYGEMGESLKETDSSVYPK